MTDRTLRKSIYLAAAPETVWEFLTDPDLLEKWFHRPTTPLKSGEDLDMRHADGKSVIWGKVNDARAPEYLEYTFQIAPLGEAETLVKWRLEPVDGGTKLSLEHSGLPAGAAAFGLTLALDKGWDEHLGRLRSSSAD